MRCIYFSEGVQLIAVGGRLQSVLIAIILTLIFTFTAVRAYKYSRFGRYGRFRMLLNENIF